jgi:hypothetical protein
LAQKVADDRWPAQASAPPLIDDKATMVVNG